jgi:hypothetical protein
MTATARSLRHGAFLTIAVLVNLLVLRFHAEDKIRAALFFDCAVTVPVCYWLLLVRSGLRGRTSLVAIAFVSLLRGAYLLPSAAMVAEVGLVVFMATQVKRLRAEIDVYRYAFGLSSPLVLPESAKAFTIHEASGGAMLFWVIALLTPVDAGLMHFLLPVKLAWILTAMSAYGAVWMIAMARSFAALPIVVGMMSSLYIPSEAIASVSREGGDPRYARFTLLSDPTVWIAFHRPLTMMLPMGFTRQVDGAAVSPDDAPGFFQSI